MAQSSRVQVFDSKKAIARGVFESKAALRDALLNSWRNREARPIRIID
jgi:hypothetical protein